MDAEVANLERALEAVRARSTRALANEQLYHARIRELEQMNRALVVQLASLTGSDETRADAASARLVGAAEREGSSAEGSPARAHPARVASYKTLRTKTNRLSVERVDLDDGAGSDGVPDAPCSGGRLGDADGVGATNPRDSAAESESGDGPATIERLASEFAGEVRLSASRGNNDGLGGFESRGGPTGDDPDPFSVVGANRPNPEEEASAYSSARRARAFGPDAGLPSSSSSDPGSDAEPTGVNHHHSNHSSDHASTRGERGAVAKVPFQLLLCNDDGCEVREPLDRAIRTRQHGVPHSQFTWVSPPRNVLVVKKPNDKDTTAMLPGVVRILEERGITAWVEPAVHWETGLGRTWTHDEDPRLDRFVDFIVCLGGDGTILWVSNLFPRACPPVISFAMGSLGFLTAFEVESVPEALRSIADGGFFFTQRSRLVARVTLPDGSEERHSARVCLNEVVIDRGASAALIELDVCIDGHPMTKVLADGVMLSTPTGSTAYSLAAGGSMVHPGVSGVLFVPICPHTLSFRPLVLPDTVVLTITVPVTARVEPVASFDGKQQRRLKRGESLVVAGWRFPVPAICKSGETGDWFRAVKDSLLWNVRGAVQKPYGEEKSAT